MKRNWWKVLCVVLLSWTFIAGLVVPMRPGITDVTPYSVKVGDTVSLSVHGYNTQWAGATNGKAWLHIDEFFKVEKEGKKTDSLNVYAIESVGFESINAQQVSFRFVIPPYLPTATKLENASLLVSVAGAEQALRPEAIAVTQDTMNVAAGKTLWNANLDIERPWKFAYPYRNILQETLRNTFFHVPMWFVMFTLFGVAIFYGIQYLRFRRRESDIKAVAFTQAGVLFGFLGLFTGGLWANYAWGQPFPLDIKIIMTYTALAIYLAYFILRGAFDDVEKKARISAVYSIFAFSTLIPLLYVVPKLAPDSLHPGNGSNIAFGSQDLDNTMRLVFYPASIGWILLGVWIATLVYRTQIIEEKLEMGEI